MRARIALTALLGMTACAGPPAGGRAGPARADTTATGGDLRPDDGRPASIRTDAPPPAALRTVDTAVFVDARAVGADASGRLYVVDAGAAHVVVFGRDGRGEAVLGGPGTADESLVEPVDVDPTNGNAVYVADAGTGRVVRFTAERRAAEAIPVPDGDARDALAGRRDEPRGRPVAVAAGPGDLLYVVEARRGVVLAFDRARRVERTLGGPDAGSGALRAPTALAVDGRGRLFVVDAGTVRTFDAFGSPGPALDLPGVARSVSAAEGIVLVAGEAGVTTFRDGVAVGVFEAPGPLVDAAVTSGVVWGLTRTRLVRLGPLRE